MAHITGRRHRLFIESRESTRIPTGRRRKKLQSNAGGIERELSLLSSRGLTSDRTLALALALVPVPAPALVLAPVPAPLPALVRDHLCAMPVFRFITPRLVCTTPRARHTTDMDLLTRVNEQCRRMHVVTADRSEVVDACINKSLRKFENGERRASSTGRRVVKLKGGPPSLPGSARSRRPAHRPCLERILPERDRELPHPMRQSLALASRPSRSVSVAAPLRLRLRRPHRRQHRRRRFLHRSQLLAQR